MRIKTLLQGAVSMIALNLFGAGIVGSLRLAALEADAHNEPGGWAGPERTKRSGKSSGGSLAHRQWRKRRSSGRM